ncbi:MAG: c-type cytochrome biogenesis protein CcmI [Candidatus Thiodiazotropha sp.]
MTLFWIIAAGLMVLAMAFIVLPLLRKRFRTGISSNELNLSVFKQQIEELDNDLKAGILDQERYDAAKIDLEKELLSDITDNMANGETTDSGSKGRWMLLAALAIPLVAVSLYLTLGSPQIIPLMKNPPVAAGASQGHPGTGGNSQMPPLDELVRRLAEKMKENPDNLEGWVMLGRSYVALKQYPEAMDAYEHAMKLDSENVGLLLAYGEAIGAMSGNNFTGKPAPLIEKAFKLEPENPNALWMAGILAYQQGDYKSALTRWEKLQGKLTPQSTELETVSNAIDDVRSKLGLAPAEPKLPSIAQANQSTSQPNAAAAAGGGNSVQVKVTLSPDLKGKVSPNDLVFVYAKAVSGPPMPLAAARKRVSDLPLTLTLDDSMAMMPQMRISAFPKVKVGARVSLSGSPTAQSGDLEGEVTPVTPGQADQVSVVINTVHP